MPDGEISPTQFYKYFGEDSRALSCFTEGTLMYTCPLDFNDPFDCSPRYERVTLKSMQKNRPGELRQHTARSGMSAGKYFQNRHRGIRAINEEISSGVFNRKLISAVGVVSLTVHPDHLLMWSHYGHHHKGFALIINVANESDHVPDPNSVLDLIPLKVTYDTKRPSIDLSKSRTKDETKAILTKSPHWEYEDEWRHIDYRRGPGPHPFNVKKHLIGAIGGARISPQFEKTLHAAMRTCETKYGVELKYYRAKLSDKNYEIEVPELS